MKRSPGFLVILTLFVPACDEPEQTDFGDSAQTFRCIADWELVEAAKTPCHIDIDNHAIYREAEAYGVDVYIDGNGCFAGKRYHKVELEHNKCTWNIPAHTCAAQLYYYLEKALMPDSVYDTDTCPYPRLWEEQGGGGGGGGGGSQAPK